MKAMERKGSYFTTAFAYLQVYIYFSAGFKIISTVYLKPTWNFPNGNCGYLSLKITNDYYIAKLMLLLICLFSRKWQLPGEFYSLPKRVQLSYDN